MSFSPSGGWSSWLWDTASWTASRLLPVMTVSASSASDGPTSDLLTHHSGHGDAGARYRSGAGGSDAGGVVRLIPQSPALSSASPYPIASASSAAKGGFLQWSLVRRVLQGVGVACFFVAMLYLAQDKLIYHPSRYSDDSDYYFRLRSRGIQLQHLPAAALQWRAPSREAVLAAAAPLAALDPRLASVFAAPGPGEKTVKLPIVPIPLLDDDMLASLAAAAGQRRAARATAGEANEPMPPPPTAQSLRDRGVAYVITPPLDNDDDETTPWDGPDWSPLRGLVPASFFTEPHAVWVLFTANAQLALDWAPVAGGLLAEYTRHVGIDAARARARSADPQPRPPRVCVLLVDHPGYGASPGFPAPAGIADAGTRALDSLLALSGGGATRPGGAVASAPALPALPRARVLTGGFSLGCAAALMLQRTLETAAASAAPAPGDASSVGPWASEGGALLLAPFTSLLAAARALVFRGLPAFMLRHSYDNVAALAAVAKARASQAPEVRPLPVAVFHGTEDGIVPIQQGRALVAPYTTAAAAGVRARLTEVPGAGHNAVTDAAWPGIAAAFVQLTLGKTE